MRLSTLLAAVCAVFLLWLPSPSDAASSGFTTADLNLRAGPGTRYRVIGVMPQGTIVAVADCAAAWCRVSFGAKHGWASRRYLDVVTVVRREPVPPPGWRGYTSRRLRVQGAELDYKWHVAAAMRARFEREHNDSYDCYVQTDGLIVCRED